jgi:hypothetical protein
MIFTIRPARNVCEGAIGYLMRLAQAHGVPRLSEMMTQVGVPWFELAQGMHAAHIASTVRADVDGMEYDTARLSAPGILLRGQLLRRRQWSVHTGRRACPVCLAEDASTRASDRLPRAWHRNWWDIRTVTVCPVHRVKLVGCCGVCRAKLDFRSTAIGECLAGHPIASMEIQTVEGYAGDAYIVARIAGLPRPAVEVLDSGSLGEAMEILELTGAACLAGHRIRDAAALGRHAVLDAGYRTFSRWPVAFDEMLEVLASQAATGPGKWGASATYGAFHSRLLAIEGQAAEKLKERVRRHALAHGVAISKPVFGVSEEPREFCSVRHAAERMGMGFERARRELGVRGLLPKRTRRGTPIRIAVAAVDEIIARRRCSIGVTGAAERLGIGRTQARRLAARGMFGTDPARFLDSDVGVFLERVSRNADDKFDRSTAVSIPDGCRTARCPMDVAVAAVLNGRLRLSGFQQGRGLAGAFVAHSELRELGKQARGTMPLNDAAAALGVKWEALRGLVRLQLLKCGPSGVSRSDLDAFRRDFVACARLAQSAGVAPRCLIKLLAEAGVAPVAAPPRCRQVFYRRSEVLKSKSGCPKHRVVQRAARS